MAHFAQLDENNIVVNVIVVSNETLNNDEFPESENLGVSFCKSLYGEDTCWAQTSYNASFRYNYAGIGYTFNPAPTPNGAFIPPKPYSSWLLDEATFRWVPPVPYPVDGNVYVWNETNCSWVPLEQTL